MKGKEKNLLWDVLPVEAEALSKLQFFCGNMVKLKIFVQLGFLFPSVFHLKQKPK